MRKGQPARVAHAKGRKTATVCYVLGDSLSCPCPAAPPCCLGDSGGPRDERRDRTSAGLMGPAQGSDVPHSPLALSAPFPPSPEKQKGRQNIIFCLPLFLSPLAPSGGATLRFHVTSDVGRTVRRRYVALQYVALVEAVPCSSFSRRSSLLRKLPERSSFLACNLQPPEVAAFRSPLLCSAFSSPLSSPSFSSFPMC